MFQAKDSPVQDSDRQQRVKQLTSGQEGNLSFLVISLPFILSTLCYLNSLNGEFVHDDVFAIKTNADVTGETSAWGIWRNDFWGRDMMDSKSHKSYRPLTTLSFRLDYFLSGGHAPWFHLVNVTLHACVSYLVAHMCLRNLLMCPMSALATSCLFAVHPVHTEAVSGIVGRADILAALFFLLSFSFYSRSTHTELSSDPDHATHSTTSLATYLDRNLVTSLLLAVAATLSKETGIAVLGVCFLYDVIKCRQHLVTLTRPTTSSSTALTSMSFRLASLSLTAVGILITRAWLMNFQLPEFREEDNPASFSNSSLTRVLNLHHLFPCNAWLLFCPAVLCYDWSGASIPLLVTCSDPRNLTTLVFYAILLYLVWKCWNRLVQCIDHSVTDDHTIQDGQTSRDQTACGVPVLAMGLVLLCVPFLPASNLFFRVGFVMAERVLYIPSIGFCLLVSLGLSKMVSRYQRAKGHLMTLFVLVLLVLSARTWTRNLVWMTRHSLFWSGVKTVPLNAKVHYNMANLYRDTGNEQGAIHHYRIAIRLNPLHASYHNNLGTLLSDPHEAARHFEEAIRLHPNHKGAWVNLGNLLVDQGNSSGLVHIKRALQIDPNYVNALLSMGKSMIVMGRYSEAETFIKQAIQHRPDLSEAYIYYGALFQKTGQLENAVSAFQQALKLSAHNTMAMRNAATSLRLLRRYSEAEELLQHALTIHGDSASYSQLGILYSEMGNNLDALFAHKEALVRAPNDTALNLKYIQALADCNQHEEVGDKINKLLARVPQNLDVLRFAFAYKQKNGKLNEAFQHLEIAIAQARLSDHPSLGQLYQDQANVHIHWNDLDKALKCFKLSLDADPALIESYINIGTIHHKKKKFEEAETFYLKALSMNPGNEVARKNLEKLGNVWPGNSRSLGHR